MKERKVILVTGASSGIGRAIALYLSREGHTVFGTSRNPQKAKQGDQELTNLNIIKMDVRDENSIEEAVKTVFNQYHRIDVVINNAGMGIAGSVEDTEIEEAKKQFEVNFFGVHRVCQKVIPIMRKQSQGYVINISSLAGIVAIPFQPFYTASKFALEGYTETLRMELSPFGIKVVLVEPGDFNTPFTKNREIVESAKSSSVYSKRFKSALKAQEKSEKQGANPEKIAKLIGKIIQRPFPRLRYPVGPSSILVGLRRFVPDKIREVAVRKVYNV